MKRELEKNLKTNNKSGVKTRKLYIKKHYPDDYHKIINIREVDNWYEKLYWYINEFNMKPMCKNKNCNNRVNFISYSRGYYQYCSIKCRNTDKNLIEENKKLLIKKYGVDNPMKISEVKKKSKKTKKEKYNNENFINIDKIKKTKREKYGNEYYNNRKKAIKTSITNFGEKNINNREKAKQTMLNKYGVDVYSKSTYFSKKVNETYNNKTPDEISKINNKRKQTILNKYGVEHFSQSQEFKNNIIKKRLNDYTKKLNINLNQIEYDLNKKTFKIKNFCDNHDEFDINYYVLKNRLMYGIKDICTICNPVSSNNSISEKEILNFITNELQYEGNKIKINNKEIDIFITNNNVGIEYNGLYWHSTINVNKNYHLNKTELCEKNNIQLLHIFENEWKNKKKIVKSIIKSKLNIIENKIYARKCTIININPQTSKKFLNENHIQGNVNSKIKLGLIYNNELVSIMTFGNLRKSLGSKNVNDGYEMLRFCNKLNTQVIGGASKLLKHFIKTYEPKFIISYADRRYSNGELYRKLGFDFVKYTKPNYWYFKPHEYILHHRFKFRKDVLIKEGFDSQKTEHQIMSERGYYRIYDSGNMKFILKLQL